MGRPNRDCVEEYDAARLTLIFFGFFAENLIDNCLIYL